MKVVGVQALVAVAEQRVAVDLNPLPQICSKREVFTCVVAKRNVFQVVVKVYASARRCVLQHVVIVPERRACLRPRLLVHNGSHEKL